MFRFIRHGLKLLGSEKNEVIVSLDKVLRESMATVPGCLAAGCVNMNLGMLLALHTLENHPREIFDLFAGATTELFQGGYTMEIENVWRKLRNQSSGNHYFKEIIVMSDNNIHVFLRGKTNQELAIVYITPNTENIGMVLSRSRLTVEKIEAVT